MYSICFHDLTFPMQQWFIWLPNLYACPFLIEFVYRYSPIFQTRECTYTAHKIYILTRNLPNPPKKSAFSYWQQQMVLYNSLWEQHYLLFQLLLARLLYMVCFFIYQFVSMMVNYEFV